MNNKIGGIYQIRNLIDNKIYIGSTNNFHRRKTDHFTSLKNNRHCNWRLQTAYKKYGEQNFIFEIVEICDNVTEKLLETREQWHIDTTKCLDPEFGYNISTITGSYSHWTGKKFEQYHKDKISAALKNQPKSLSHVKNASDARRGVKIKKTASKYIGVSWEAYKNRWRARINKYGKRYSIGRFKTEEEAALAYNKKAIELFGLDAKINIIN